MLSHQLCINNSLIRTTVPKYPQTLGTSFIKNCNEAKTNVYRVITVKAIGFEILNPHNRVYIADF